MYFRLVGAAAVIAVMSAIAGCGAIDSSSATASGSGTVPSSASPTTSPSASPSRAPIATFTLTVGAAFPAGDTFQLDLEGMGAPVRQLFGFCGAPGPACVEGQIYPRRFGGLSAGETLTYKFERATAAGGIYVFNQGTFPLEGDHIVLATYAG